MTRYRSALCWFRRDLRDHDHAALASALRDAGRVHCAFVLDRTILDRLEDRADRRVEFIMAALEELHAALKLHGGGLIVRHGVAVDEIRALALELKVDAVYVNRDYEPDAKRRDVEVAEALGHLGIAFHHEKDQVIFDGDEVLTRASTPFSVFTPYKNAWLAGLRPSHLAPHVVEPARGALADSKTSRLPSLGDIGFTPTNLRALPIELGMRGAQRMFERFLERIDRYRETRDYPARADGASNLSMHLRFGTISIRTVARAAHARMLEGDDGAAVWLSELIWRDFYFMILDRHPAVVAHAYKPLFDAIPFPSDPGHFAAWCEGRTGYPLIDAAQRCLNATGMMHNRLRMVSASFLVKDLHVDWRKGERDFAARLNDYDLSANNGGWQWAASTGCDAQPWFRIFNPVTQSKRFDPDAAYIRLHLPELGRVPNQWIHEPWKMPPDEQSASGIVIGQDYPLPIVDHDTSRKTTLELYDLKQR